MKSKDRVEETVARIMALPEREQVEEMARMLNALPEEGRKSVLAYFQIIMDEPLNDGERSA